VNESLNSHSMYDENVMNRSRYVTNIKEIKIIMKYS
jgi:hypothetical protein